MSVSDFCIGKSSMNHDGFSTPTNAECVVFLFQSLVLTDQVKYSFAVIGTFCMGVLLEYLVSVTSNNKKKQNKASLKVVKYGIFLIQTALAYFLMVSYEKTKIRCRETNL
jgi:hypothetical protein